MEDLELDALEVEWAHKTGLVNAIQARSIIMGLIATIRQLREDIAELKSQAFSPLEARLMALADGTTDPALARRTAHEALGWISHLKGSMTQIRIDARSYLTQPPEIMRQFIGRLLGRPIGLRAICLTPGCRRDPDPDSDYCSVCRGTLDTPPLG